MPNVCTVCMLNSNRNKDISFFSYPKDQMARHQWLREVGREDLIGKLDEAHARRNYRICERHFDPSCIKFSKSKTVKYLNEYAYPTLNLPSSYGSANCKDNYDCKNIPSAEDSGTTIVNILDENSLIVDKGGNTSEWQSIEVDSVIPKEENREVKKVLKKKKKEREKTEVQLYQKPDESLPYGIKTEGQTNSQITPIQLEISDITDEDAELDAYDRFALSIAKKIKSIHAIAGRIRLMNAVQDLVDNFCSTNPHEPNDSATQLIMHVPMVDGSVMAQGVIVERQVRESKEETVNSEQVMQPSASIVDQPVHVQQITIDPKPSVEKKPRRTPAKRRKVAELPKTSPSKEQHNSQVPAETTLPTEFVSLGLKHEAQLGHNDGEPKPHIDILEIKQEKVQEEETATESTATTSSASAKASIPGITFINDPIPIKVEVIDMEEF